MSERSESPFGGVLAQHLLYNDNTHSHRAATSKFEAALRRSKEVKQRSGEQYDEVWV